MYTGNEDIKDVLTKELIKFELSRGVEIDNVKDKDKRAFLIVEFASQPLVKDVLTGYEILENKNNFFGAALSLGAAGIGLVSNIIKGNKTEEAQNKAAREAAKQRKHEIEMARLAQIRELEAEKKKALAANNEKKILGMNKGLFFAIVAIVLIATGTGIFLKLRN